AFRAERAAIDRMIGVPLDVDDLRDRVLRLVAECMNDGAGTDRTIRTGAARFAGAGDLEDAGLGVDRSQVEPEGGDGRAAGERPLQENSSRDRHLLLRTRRLP